VRGEELTFLSDLHLGGGGSTDPFDDDAALVALIDDLAASARAGAPARRLVLLGDTLDLVVAGASGHGARAAITGLRRIAAAHGEVFASLRRAIASGVRVEVVPGNHDAELALPTVREAFLRLVGRVRVRPWLVHVPGLVLAEHGQQHHCLNRFRGLPGLATGAARGLGPRPPAAVYDGLVARRAAGRGPVPHALGLTLAAPRLALGVVRAVGRGDVAGGAEGLSAAVLSELDAAAAASAGEDLVRLARLAVRRGGVASFASTLPGAAARVGAILARYEVGVAFFVCGHSHVVADVALAAAPHARYLNGGCWVPDRTFVTVGRTLDGVAYARVEAWDPMGRVRRAA
jgi:UDP-2,3-diacylglucosamine pyrophosphatase LpxH